jgi:hypothetical protein
MKEIEEINQLSDSIQKVQFDTNSNIIYQITPKSLKTEN